jgi:hypothetical protein
MYGHAPQILPTLLTFEHAPPRKPTVRPMLATVVISFASSMRASVQLIDAPAQTVLQLCPSVPRRMLWMRPGEQLPTVAGGAGGGGGEPRKVRSR